MARIFISYRREDSDIWVGRLADELCRHFPIDQVFQDVASIDPGTDFRTVLDEALASAAAMLVVIGPRWLSATDKQGRKRLEQPADLVRQEIAESLSRPGVRVFPLLVGGAEMPGEEDLPEPLKPLAQRQAFELTVRHWTNDVVRLVQTLKRAPGLADDGKRDDDVARRQAEQEEARRELEQRAAKDQAQRRAAEEQAGKSAAEDTRRRVEAEARRGADAEARRKAAEEDNRPGAATAPAPRPRWKVPAVVGALIGFALLAFFALSDRPERPAVPAAPVASTPAPSVAAPRPQPDATVEQAPPPKAERPERRPVSAPPVASTPTPPAAAPQPAAQVTETTGKPYRLLSEAEWEYAARAGTTTRYPWGDAPGTNNANLRDSGSRWGGKQTAPVGSFNAKRFGLHDMIGNVWECVQGCYNANYRGAPVDGRAWERGDCGSAIVRGGSWLYVPNAARAATRQSMAPGFRRDDLGFRVARAL